MPDLHCAVGIAACQRHHRLQRVEPFLRDFQSLTFPVRASNADEPIVSPSGLEVA